MDKNISITVPMDYSALSQAAAMFRGLAEDIAPAGTKAERPEPEPEPEVSTTISGPSSEETIAQLKEAAEEIKHPEAADVFAPVQESAPVAETAPSPVIEGGLDINSIPWDTRIHASTKTKTVDGAWKNKRGVDKEVLKQIEWELKNAQSNPETVLTEPTPAAVEPVAETTPPPAPAPATAAPVTPVHPPAATTPAPAATSEITTFPALMAAITNKAISPDVVLNATQKAGLDSFPLLAARPDLIPTVAKELGL